MKSLLLTFAVILGVGVTASAQEPGPTIEFEKEVHDYGNIEQNADGSCEFKFTNNGTEPLIISNAKGSCGCTVPTWPREPILPGKSATIKVKYDTKRIGPINKSVTITSNAANFPTKLIRIKGNVSASNASTVPVSKPNSSAPVNH